MHFMKLITIAVLFCNRSQDYIFSGTFSIQTFLTFVKLNMITCTPYLQIVHENLFILCPISTYPQSTKSNTSINGSVALNETALTSKLADLIKNLNILNCNSAFLEKNALRSSFLIYKIDEKAQGLLARDDSVYQ